MYICIYVYIYIYTVQGAYKKSPFWCQSLKFLDDIAAVQTLGSQISFGPCHIGGSWGSRSPEPPWTDIICVGLRISCGYTPCCRISPFCVECDPGQISYFNCMSCFWNPRLAQVLFTMEIRNCRRNPGSGETLISKVHILDSTNQSSQFLRDSKWTSVGQAFFAILS